VQGCANIYISHRGETDIYIYIHISLTLSLFGCYRSRIVISEARSKFELLYCSFDAAHFEWGGALKHSDQFEESGILRAPDFECINFSDSFPGVLQDGCCRGSIGDVCLYVSMCVSVCVCVFAKSKCNRIRCVRQEAKLGLGMAGSMHNCTAHGDGGKAYQSADYRKY
jgi:hypothetical protein